MKIHEYQAKQLLREAGIAVPAGIMATTAEEATAAFNELAGPLAVVKAQIHAGGRGKGTIKSNPKQHGVQLVRSAGEAASAAGSLLNQELVTIQTGPEGQTVRRILVEAGCEIARELYLGIVIDRAAGLPVLMASSAGGMNIEDVAEKTPELIFKEPFCPDAGLQSYQIRKLANKLELTGASVRSAEKFMKALARLFVNLDCSLLEINPLVVTKAGDLLALDAKISFDDNALFRHPQLQELRDISEEDPNELRAGKAGLSYVQLEGNIGCLVNGAGLAMATMDLIKLHGGEPANFLDVGGGANAEQIKNAFRILMADKNVKAVLINIFGGILRCDVLAQGVIAAVTDLGVPVPIVVRMEGTNVEEGKRMLKESGLKFATADSMGEAADKVVALAKGGN